MTAHSEVKPSDIVLLISAAVLFCLTFIVGGDSANVNLGMMAAELVAVPLLIYAVFQCAIRGRLAAAPWAVAVVALIMFIPLLQLLPLPASLWSLSADRLQLLQDLKVAGVASVDQRWTLSPAATERAFYFLLPGLALFFCMLALGRSAWRRMLALVVILCVVNLILAFAQVVGGQQSILNMYPDFAPAMGGIFANRNHQADFLAMGLMLVSVFFLDVWKRRQDDRHATRKAAVLALLGVVFVFALPLVGSRAGVIVAMIMLLGVLLSSGLPSMRSFRKNRLLQVGSIVALVVFVVGLYAAIAWMQVDVGDEGSRRTLLTETLRIGAEQSPLGSGIGTFVPIFQAGASDALLMHAYVNNAHNEYAQWWLEAGVVGVFVTILALALLIKTLVSLLRQRNGSSARVCGMAAMMGIGVVILHSTVDYPLRTQSLLAVFGVLAGIAIAAASSGSAAEAPGRHRRISTRDNAAVH